MKYMLNLARFLKQKLLFRLEVLNTFCSVRIGDAHEAFWEHINEVVRGLPFSFSSLNYVVVTSSEHHKKKSNIGFRCKHVHPSLYQIMSLLSVLRRITGEGPMDERATNEAAQY